MSWFSVVLVLQGSVFDETGRNIVRSVDRAAALISRRTIDFMPKGHTIWIAAWQTACDLRMCMRILEKSLIDKFTRKDMK